MSTPVLRRWFCRCWFIVFVPSIVCMGSEFVFCWFALLYVLSSFAIILTRKRERERELAALLLFSFGCLVTVHVLWLFCWWVCGLWVWYFLIILTYFLTYENAKNHNTLHLYRKWGVRTARVLPSVLSFLKMYSKFKILCLNINIMLTDLLYVWVVS